VTLARSDATGQGSLDPAVLRFTTSLPVDEGLFAADVAGSLAHLRMLEEAQLIPAADAAKIRQGLLSLFEEAQFRGVTAARRALDQLSRSGA